MTAARQLQDRRDLTVLEFALELHQLGYAIHWLHPNSKKPIGDGWSKRKRQSFAQLQESYRDGNNVGVLLGRESKIDGAYLAVVDFDLKSSDEKHRKEMLGALNRLFPGLFDSAPFVESGRRNGSGHFHVRTREPAKTTLLAGSSDYIAGSKRQRAWEIVLMGEGAQVALPPSRHPDSGKLYVWRRKPVEATSLPLIDPPSKSKKEKDVGLDFNPLDVDLKRFALPDEILYALSQGEDYEGNADQSALAFKCAIAMVKAGATDQEITSILIDSDRFALGSIGFRHRNTESASDAWAWVYQYCVKKARAEFDAASEFDRDVQVTDEEAALIAAQETETREAAWMEGFKRKSPDGPPTACHENLYLALTKAIGENAFKRNLFSRTNIYGVKPPWGAKKVGDEVSDDDIVNIVFWCIENFRFTPRDNIVHQTIAQIALKNQFHPVQEYILKTEWDGTPRISTWLKKYIGAEAKEPYLSAISRKVLCAMVARVFQPGIDFQTVLILEGKQGVGKSSVIKILGGEWVLDAYLDLRNKDTVQSMFGKWVVELGELASLKHADLEMTKAFFSRSIDRIRVSHGRLAEDFPRQCIFIGTTNDDEYLKDDTGERRFWPIKTQDKFYDLEGLRRDRDQLLAEAYFVWRNCGEELRLSPDENAAAIEEQTQRKVTDLLADKLESFFEQKTHDGEEGKRWEKFTMSDVFSDFGPLPQEKPDYINIKRAGAALRKLGFTKKVLREDGKSKKCWIKGYR